MHESSPPAPQARRAPSGQRAPAEASGEPASEAIREALLEGSMDQAG